MNKILLMFMMLFMLTSCNKPSGLTTSNTVDSLQIYKDSLYHTQFVFDKELAIKDDSIRILKDSVEIFIGRFETANSENIRLDEELAVANIKLLRIKEYNRIAAQRNNIKYLRGWINRVLTE